MTEEKKIEKTKEEKVKALKTKANTKKKVDMVEYGKQLTTRARLERDYKEDVLYVAFESSPETKRTILSRKPNQDEFLTILGLSVQAAKYEGKLDAESLEKMTGIYAGMHTMAANLSVDKDLDEEFWSKHVSFNTLQSFISQLIVEFQTGSKLPEDEMKSFRGK